MVMQKTIIALWGTKNVGKTTTIGWAYKRLRRKREATNSLNICTRFRKELVATLDINGVKVGFASPGDTPRILEEYVQILIEEGCIVIVCATHTRRSKTWTVVERPEYDLVRIEKACPQIDHDDGNRKKADELISEVRKAIETAQLPRSDRGNG
jgi:hypothetical protein